MALAAFAIASSRCMLLTNPIDGLAVRSVQLDGQAVPYAVFVPSTYQAARPLPAILLVHGAGGNGPDFLDIWRSFAESHGIILVAPTLSLTAYQESRVPDLFPLIMRSVQAEWSVDARRMYQFGYSAGGYSVFTGAMMQPAFFAASGVYASIIAPSYDSIVTRPLAPSGVAIYIGDHDQFFSLDQTRRTRDLLLAHGYDVHYVELAGRDHDFEAASGQVIPDAWAYLTQFPR